MQMRHGSLEGLSAERSSLGWWQQRGSLLRASAATTHQSLLWLTTSAAARRQSADGHHRDLIGIGAAGGRQPGPRAGRATVTWSRAPATWPQLALSACRNGFGHWSRPHASCRLQSLPRTGRRHSTWLIYWPCKTRARRHAFHENCHYGRSKIPRVPRASPSAKNRALGEDNLPRVLHSGKKCTRGRKTHEKEKLHLTVQIDGTV
jgi:hypothetical protein